MRIIFVLLVSFLLISSCKEIFTDNIVLVSGREMNPNSRRFGIEISDGILYYCEEMTNKKGEYDYYFCNIPPNYFDEMQFLIQKSFDEKILLSRIEDATPYDLFFSFNEKKDSIRFYSPLLNDKQSKVFNKIIDFTELNKPKMKRMVYHKFPKYLLTEKLLILPEPLFK
jgi:hypothetical protein